MGGGNTSAASMCIQVQAFKTADYKAYLSYINGFAAKANGVKTCSFFRDDMLIFSNTICFKTISAFADQVKWLCLMGPFLCLMAICMFAAIRCPFEKDEDDKKTKPYEQPGEANTQ